MTITDEILRDLQAEYEQQRQRDLEIQRQRRETAEQRCPGLKEALDERENLSYDSMRGILAGQGSYSGLPEKMEALNRRVASLLTGCGLDAAWLDPVYRCSRCRDTGYTGEPIREMCDCMRGEYYRRLYRRVGLPDAD